MRCLPARTGGVYAFPVTTTPITDSNREFPSDEELTAAAVHQISHDVRQMALDMAYLRAAWERYEPIVAAFQRGGMLAARTAAKAARRGT